MSQKTKLKKILDALTNADDKNLAGFQAFDDGVTKLKAELKQNIQVNTLDEVNGKLDNFRKNIDLTPIIQAVNTLHQEFDNQVNNLISQLDSKSSELTILNRETDSTSLARISELNDEISNVRGQIKDATDEKDADLEELRQELLKTLTDADSVSDKQISDQITVLDGKINELEVDLGENKTELATNIDNVAQALPKLKAEIFTKIAGMGGGNMNRNISVGGNSSVLSRYTDINLKPGANVTLSYSNNDTTKNLDLTIAASGGGGGTSRSISTVTVSSVIAAVSGTDYVILANAGIQLTLPTAVSNTNLYTIKNIGSSSVLIGTTSSQTIDTSSTIIMPVQFTSIDLISDSANWQIT